MMRSSVTGHNLCLFLLAAGLVGCVGCFPSSLTPPDEFKNPHYLAGKSRVANLDFAGAIAAFEKALQDNPNSAAAHLELGLLFESERVKEYAAAIYHFEKHLKLKPDSNVADGVRQRIHSCKLELAKSVSFALVTRVVQARINGLERTNEALAETVRRLNAMLAAQTAGLTNRSIAYSGGDFAGGSGMEAGRQGAGLGRSAGGHGQTRSARELAAQGRGRPSWHEVKPGETFFSISRDYGLEMEALTRANPGVNPRRLRAGQRLTLP